VTALQENILSSNTILYCRQWEKTVEFYRDGLKMPVLFSNDWFVEFKLTEQSRLSIADENRSAIKSCGGIGITLAIEVDNLETVWEYAKKNSLKPTWIQNHPWNARVFYLFDPEGHRIELWQPSFRHFDV
jgi:catechol 2,3-dioxygenase-like lactoylglutathione lyase family enzyme